MKDNQKLKILLCESDTRIAARLESWIRTLGADVASYIDGLDGLEAFKEKRFDIVLVSDGLNSMGAIELVAELKKIVPNQAVVLMLSENDTIFKRAIELQVDKYLNKPVEATSLFNTIGSLSQEKLWHKEFKLQKKVLQDYKDAIDFSFSVSRHDKKGNLIYVNELFCKSTKLTHSEAMSGVINPLKNTNEDMNKVWQVLEDEKIYRARQVFIVDGVNEKIIDVTAVALVDENDITYEYLVFTDDVTKIVHSARKIKNQELDNRLEKINHAKELNKIKDSFLTIFTHELKTPLNSIINFSQYVQKHLAKEEFKKKEKLLVQIEEIYKSGIFMLHMITNLMEAMKLKDSKIKLKPKSLELNSTVDSLLLSISSKFGSKSVINISSTTDDVRIMSDEERVIQILEHIILNAINYADSKVSISISSDEYSFMIEVCDDGDGFSDKTNVFNLFEQSDPNSLTRESVGVGTGLFIVKQLCDKMRYKIKISDSEVLGGASIAITGKKEMK